MSHAARCPALVVSAAASGQGKTTVTAALARLHERQGRRVRVFKCGPDYLDPYWHQLASGAQVEQLDLWMTGPADCAARLHAAACEADLILIEGVMGLFDGEDCVADLAQRFGIPVLAVVDAGAMGGTLGAIVHGLRHYREGLPWAGVLANRVAGERHADMLRAGLRDGADWLGALPRLSLDEDARAPLLPERHLGLVAANELPDALQRLDTAADALAATPLGRMDAQALQRFATGFPAPPPRESAPPLLAGRTVAVARDAAFCFIYPGNVQTLQQLGARVVFFSPLHDAALPACDAVWLPGGYPELHAGRIAAAGRFLAGLRAFPGPVHGECGGYMVLGETLVDGSGTRHAMAGLLGLITSYEKRKMHLGYRLAELATPIPGHGAGSRLRGHEFHYSTILSQPDEPLARVTDAEGAEVTETGSRRGRVTGTFFHLISGVA